MKKNLRLCLAVAMLLTCYPAASQSIAEATAIRQSGDLKTAFDMYEKLAHQGNAEAQFHLGFFYETGQVVPQNYVHAETWYKKSALQGFVKAQSSLAWLYANGLGGVKKDPLQAAIFYEKASAQGDEVADGSLYRLYKLYPELRDAVKNAREAEANASRQQALAQQQQVENEALQKESLACLDTLYNDTRTKSLAGKLLMDTRKTSSLELMANNTKPSAKDKAALSYVVAEWERCIDIHAEPRKKTLRPEIEQLISAYRLDLRNAFADLYGGKYSYGELARSRAKLDLEFNHKLSNTVASLQAKDMADARQAQEAEAQRRYAEAQNQQQREAEKQRQQEARRQLQIQEAQLQLAQQQAQQQAQLQQRNNFLQNLQLLQMLNPPVQPQAPGQAPQVIIQQTPASPPPPRQCTSTRFGSTITTNCF